jgi:hypothetical protein
MHTFCMQHVDLQIAKATDGQRTTHHIASIELESAHLLRMFTPTQPFVVLIFLRRAERVQFSFINEFCR